MKCNLLVVGNKHEKYTACCFIGFYSGLVLMEKKRKRTFEKRILSKKKKKLYPKGGKKMKKIA